MGLQKCMPNGTTQRAGPEAVGVVEASVGPAPLELVLDHTGVPPVTWVKAETIRHFNSPAR